MKREAEARGVEVVEVGAQQRGQEEEASRVRRQVSSSSPEPEPTEELLVEAPKKGPRS